MNINKLLHFIPFVIGLLLMTTAFTGCSDDDDEWQQTAFGYVQFKIYKSASAAMGAETRGTDTVSYTHLRAHET